MVEAKQLLLLLSHVAVSYALLGFFLPEVNLFSIFLEFIYGFVGL